MIFSTFSNRQKFHATGLANYCVPPGEAYVKALEIARDVSEKVCISTSFKENRNCMLHDELTEHLQTTELIQTTKAQSREGIQDSTE